MGTSAVQVIQPLVCQGECLPKLTSYAHSPLQTVRVVEEYPSAVLTFFIASARRPSIFTAAASSATCRRYTRATLLIGIVHMERALARRLARANILELRTRGAHESEPGGRRAPCASAARRQQHEHTHGGLIDVIVVVLFMIV